MRLSITPIAAVCVATFATAGVASAAGATPELVQARNAYENGDWKAVIATLGPKLYPQSHLRNDEELREAHYLLATAHFYAGDKQGAEDEFAALLFLDPDRTLNPATEPPAVCELFNAVKNERRAKLDEIRKQQQRDQDLKNRPAMELRVDRVIHEPSGLSNFIPFGYPQFRNGDKGKGYLFLGGELLTAGLSIGLFAAQATQYGLWTSNVPHSDISKVETMQIIQASAGAAFFVLYGLSVWDGFARQQPTVEETRSEQPIEPAITRPTSAPSSLLILPTVTPNSVGIGAVWSF